MGIVPSAAEAGPPDMGGTDTWPCDTGFVKVSSRVLAVASAERTSVADCPSVCSTEATDATGVGLISVASSGCEIVVPQTGQSKGDADAAAASVASSQRCPWGQVSCIVMPRSTSQGLKSFGLIRHYRSAMASRKARKPSSNLLRSCSLFARLAGPIDVTQQIVGFLADVGIGIPGQLA